MQLAVNEIFDQPTIQGEGPSAGTPCTFLRLAGCNLACNFCDTPYTWNWKGTHFVHQEKYDKEAEVHLYEVSEVVEKVRKSIQGTKMLVISGGEPLLQQKALTEFLQEFNYGYPYRIEVETNGTIIPEKDFFDQVSQFNCSPKLKNSGPDNQIEKRYIPTALKMLQLSGKSVFKFVVDSETDMNEIVALVTAHRLDPVYLMPQCRTKEEQDNKRLEVTNLAIKYGFKFTPRQHIDIWGNKRGV